MELDPFAQVEGVGQGVLGHVPMGGEARNDLGATALELGETVEQGFGRGVEIGAGGVLGGIETGGTAFGAVDQVACGLGGGGGGEQTCANQERNDCGFQHGGLIVVIFGVRAAS